MGGQHSMVRLALAQRAQKTLYCAGLDPHSFGDYENNMRVYGFMDGGETNVRTEAFDFYAKLAGVARIPLGETTKLAALLSAIERYFCLVISMLHQKCNIRVFKPQFGLFIQFGPIGAFLLQRIKGHIDSLKDSLPTSILDCKPGDISTTQAGYMLGYLGNLKSVWDIDYTPYGFDIINPTPWMGEDVLVLRDPKTGDPTLGLELLRQGKGLIYVNKTSNPSGPQYQEMLVQEDERNKDSWRRVVGLACKPTLQLLNACDAYFLSQRESLEEGGLSQFGLVVGATHPCDGSIRKVFPFYTGLNPAFGAQSIGAKALAPFKKVMLELIRHGEWNGQGGIFSSSRGTIFPWEKSYGGSGVVVNLEEDLIRAIARHRELEEEAYGLKEVVDAGIKNPFN